MIIKKIKTMVIELCRKDTWWRLHIGSVVKYSKLLAKKTNADEEVLEISAWLHDIQKIKGRRELHHVNGANEAEKIYDILLALKGCSHWLATPRFARSEVSLEINMPSTNFDAKHHDVALAF